MTKLDIKTIDLFSKRSDRTVIWLTMAFALGGGLADIGGHIITNLYGGVSMLWGVWIPFCFITIPPIHYLCRRVEIMQKRIEDLESR